MFNPHNPQTADLPFSNAPINWLEPQTVAGSELAAVLAEAKAQGYHAHRMKVLPEVIYELQFWKLPAAEAGKHFREPSKTEPAARKTCIRESFYETTFQK